MNNLFNITDFNINDTIQQKFLCKNHIGQNIFPNIFWKINNNKHRRKLKNNIQRWKLKVIYSFR